MTQNQLQYWANVETARANRAREQENYRHNIASETENVRHNKGTENIQSDSNKYNYLGKLADVRERTRHNKVEEGRAATDSRVKNATTIANTVSDALSSFHDQNRASAKTFFDIVKITGGK